MVWLFDQELGRGITRALGNKTVGEEVYRACGMAQEYKKNLYFTLGSNEALSHHLLLSNEDRNLTSSGISKPPSAYPMGR